MHPRYELDKTYEVIVDGKPSDQELDILRKGIPLEEGLTSPAEIILLKTNQKNQAKLLVKIHEGKKRQIRRMFKYITYNVIKLKRIKYGFLTLQGLQSGNYRLLTKEEVCKLRQTVGLKC